MRRTRSIGRVMIAASLIVAALGVGAGGGAWWQAARQDELLRVVADANPGASASAAVELPRNAGGQMQIVLVGLRTKAEFKIIAVTQDGQTHSLFHGQAVGGPQLVVTTMTVPPDEVTLIIAVQLDGAVVVAVPV
jgi:hypothetical protein